MVDTRDADDVVRNALDYIDETGGLISFVEEVGIGGVTMAFIYATIDAVEGGFAMIIAIPRAIAFGFVSLLDATFGGYVRMIEASTEQAVASLTGGLPTMLGPAVPLLALVIVMASVYLLFYFLDRIGFNPISIITGIRR